MCSLWRWPSYAIRLLLQMPGDHKQMTNPPQFKCNGCKRNTEFLWLDRMELPEGFRLYQCMSCGCTGVKNIAEALHIPDSDVCRCDKCGSWRFESVECHTCQLIVGKS